MMECELVVSVRSGVLPTLGERRPATSMEPLFQLVGSIVSSRPAAESIDAFVLQARRERAAVLARSATGATFVRFNATDFRLVVLACQALRGPVRSSLRFAFAVGVKEALAAGLDEMDIGARGLEQAQELASGARDGQLLVAPALSAPLIEAGFVLQSRQLRLRGGRMVPAFLLDLAGALRDGPAADATPAAEAGDAVAPTGPDADGPDAALRALANQVDQMARRQVELEWRQHLLLGRLARIDSEGVPARSWEELVADLDVQVARVETRLGVVDEFERRLERLQAVIDAVEQALADHLPRQSEIEGLRQQCDALVAQLADAQRGLDAVAQWRTQVDDLLGRVVDADSRIAGVEARRPGVEEVQARATVITHMLGDIQVTLDSLGEQRSVIDQVGERLARLDFTLQEAQNTLRALQRERDGAERIEQSLKALRARSARP